MSPLKNLTLFILFLTSFLFAFADRIVLPVWLQVAGRLHPVLLHLPIGIIVLAVFLLMLRSQFKAKQFRKLMSYCLVIAALTASLTAFFGLLLSVGGDYGEALQRHKVSGLILGWLSYVVLVFYQSSSEIKALKRGGIVLLFALLIFVGHTGSVLTHGENFVLAPLQTSQSVALQDTSLYQLAVKPILDKKCFSCHNDLKAKGKFVMTSMEKFIQGGESGAAFISGNPDSSRMIQYIQLPLEHDNHMPPDGKPQLSQFEINLLHAWVKSGAAFEKKISDYNPVDTLVLLANTVTAKLPDANTDYTFKPASADLVKNLNTPFRTIFPLYTNSPALQADFFVKEYFKIEALKELNKIKEQLVALNLSKMPVRDDDLSLLSAFNNLEILNLNFTAITGSGLSNLKTCTKLKSVSLSGTKVTVESLKPILELPAIQTLYIWNTSIGETHKLELERAHPKIRFIHTLFKDESILALSKPILVNEGVLKKNDLIQLKHTLPGVTIRYTLDGPAPDSINGTPYHEPIQITETVRLRAIACKDGWYCSNVFESTIYKEGVNPLQVELLSPPDKQYPGEGAGSLTDGRKGFVDIFKEPAWLGFRDNNFEAGFDFGDNPPTLTKFVVSYADNLGAYIFPPTEIQIWAGTNKNKLVLIHTEKFTEPKTYRTPQMSFISLMLPPSKHSYYKVVAKPINKLPAWHSGKGQKGWLFVDEVFFY